MLRDAADVLDRGAIAKLKAERIPAGDEWRIFGPAVEELEAVYPEVPIRSFFDLLYKINAMIWDLESDLRQGKIDGVLVEVGRRAISIREHNNLRVQVKNIVNQLLDQEIIEIKKNHISE
jgi:hypothetical protein